MKIDAILGNATLADVPNIARAAEKAGFDGLWSQETDHDPFLPHTLIAEHTKRLQSGTSIAVAFSRSPMNLAYSAWDLARFSGGRFVLGLGTQVKAHIERRFGMPWPRQPIRQFREMVQAIRAVWQCWQGGERLAFRGEYYRLGLMTPFFTPAPLVGALPRIYLSGVGHSMAQLAGEVGDGFFIHPFHTAESLRQITLPAICTGQARSVLDGNHFERAATVFVATSQKKLEQVRKQISFYASTPSYSSVMALHGYQENAQRLAKLAGRGKWEEMPDLIPDAFLEHVCVYGEDETSLANNILARYGGLVERVSLYLPMTGSTADTFNWNVFVQTIKGQAGPPAEHV